MTCDFLFWIDSQFHDALQVHCSLPSLLSSLLSLSISLKQGLCSGTSFVRKRLLSESVAYFMIFCYDFCSHARGRFAEDSRMLFCCPGLQPCFQKSFVQDLRKHCARQPVFDSKGTSASNHSCIKPAIASLAHKAHMHACRVAKYIHICIL